MTFSGLSGLRNTDGYPLCCDEELDVLYVLLVDEAA